MENKENKPIEVVYTKAKVGRRMLGHIMDIGFFLFAGIILFTLINVIVTNTSFYKDKQKELVVLRNESSLYIDDIPILEYVENDVKFPDYESRKIELSKGIESFYHNLTYFNSDFVEYEEYNSRKEAANDGGIKLFIKNDGIYKENPEYNNNEGWFNFYKGEIEDHALRYLLNNNRYFFLTRFSFLVSAVEILVSITVSFTVFYLIIPLTVFKRGRQTIGMKLEKIALINIDSFNLSTGKYVGRFFFMLFIMVYLNFFSFLIPSIISVSMMFFSKTSSSLVNYVFNDYMVDVDIDKIYLNALDREISQIKLQSASIENKDFNLK